MDSGRTARVREVFFIPPDASALLWDSSALAGVLSSAYEIIWRALEANVLAVVHTVSLPVSLATASVNQSHWQRLYTAQRIRARDIENGVEDDPRVEARRDEFALSSAKERFSEFRSAPEGIERLADDTCVFLENMARDKDVRLSAAELLRQGAVLTWGAFESLARDIFETMLNDRPEMVMTIIEDATAKKRIRTRFELDELAGFGFDLSKSLGSLLCVRQDFSDLTTIKAMLLPALGDDGDVATVLGEKTLWDLNQQRHVILHRRGVVDPQYLKATADEVEIGSTLEISPAQLERQLAVVVSAGKVLLRKAGRL